MNKVYRNQEALNKSPRAAMLHISIYSALFYTDFDQTPQESPCAADNAAQIRPGRLEGSC